MLIYNESVPHIYKPYICVKNRHQVTLTAKYFKVNVSWSNGRNNIQNGHLNLVNSCGTYWYRKVNQLNHCSPVMKKLIKGLGHDLVSDDGFSPIRNPGYLKIIADLPSQILQKMVAKRTSAKVPIIHSTRSPELSIYYVVTRYLR